MESVWMAGAVFSIESIVLLSMLALLVLLAKMEQKMQ